MCWLRASARASPIALRGLSALGASRAAATRFFDHFPADRRTVLDMLDRHRAGQAEFSLYVWTIYNAVAWYDYWVDKAREVRVA